jgi:hypothetical protein
MLRAHGKRYFIAPYAVTAEPAARPLLFRDARTALLFLRELVAADPRNYASVRRLFGGRHALLGTARSDITRLDGDVVLKALAARIASAELRVHITQGLAPNYHFPSPVEAPPLLIEEVPRPEPAAQVEAPPTAPSEFPEPAAQAEALREAARTGAPFCEECEKARQALAPSEPEGDPETQAAAMVAAAEQGAPFCEECEKAKEEAATAPPDLEETDPEAQAAAMQAAAEQGAPFCEECEKAKLEALPESLGYFEDVDTEAQTKSMVDAADAGVPFCEECEKAKRNA